MKRSPSEMVAEDRQAVVDNVLAQFFRAQLSRARDRSMHSIVATIQAEQDQAEQAQAEQAAHERLADGHNHRFGQQIDQSVDAAAGLVGVDARRRPNTVMS